METLQTIWTALTAQNQNLINYTLFFTAVIEVTVTMFLFTTILNISTTRKKRVIYILISAILTSINAFFTPQPYNIFINMILIPVLVFFIFERNILKAIMAEILPLIIAFLIQNFIVKFYITSILHITNDEAALVPIYRYSVMFITYAVNFILYLLVKKFNFNIEIFDSMTKKNKRLLFINSIFILIAVGTQTYLNSYYIDTFSLGIISLSIVSLLGYYFISIYSIANTTKLEATSLDLEKTKEHYKGISSLYDKMKAFKHDLNNIVQTLGGYVYTKDTDGLKIYYEQLLEECQINNNLDALNPESINHPAVYSIIAAKYYSADELGIRMNLEILLDLNSLNMKIYPFTRILGILLDNAMEAAYQCDEKIINITMRKEPNRQIVLIENTYANKDVDTERIFKKGVTSKGNLELLHGLGLWEVRQILKKSNNLNLHTTKNDQFFSQQLEMYEPKV